MKCMLSDANGDVGPLSLGTYTWYTYTYSCYLHTMKSIPQKMNCWIQGQAQRCNVVNSSVLQSTDSEVRQQHQTYVNTRISFHPSPSLSLSLSRCLSLSSHIYIHLVGLGTVPEVFGARLFGK